MFITSLSNALPLPDSGDSSRLRIERLGDVIARLRECQTRKSVAEAVLGMGCRELGARAGSVFLLARADAEVASLIDLPALRDDDALDLIAAIGYPKALHIRWARILLSTPCPAASVVRTGKPLFIASPGEWIERYPYIAASPYRNEYVARATFPLTGSERVLGSLSFSYAEEHDFSSSEKAFLSLLADQCALALERVLLRKALSESRLEALRSQEKVTWEQEARTNAEQGYRTIFDGTVQFIGLLSCDGTLLKVNRAALDFGGLEQGTVIGRLCWEIAWWSSHPLIRERFKDAVHHAVLTGECVRYETELVGAGGRVATVDLSLNPVRDEHGAVAYLIVEGRDISEHKAFSITLRESERRLREAQSIGRIGSWELDVATGRITWSPETFRLLECDLTRGEPDLEHTLEHFHEEDRPLLTEAIRRAIEDAIPYEFVVRVPLEDGTDRLLCTIGRPVRDERGRVVRLVGTVQDVTKQRQLERQIIQAEKMAALGRLAAGVAKEVGSPLAALSGTAQLLEMHPDIQVADDARVIRQMAERVHRTVRSLRRALPSGQESDQEELYSGDLNQAVEDTLDLLDHNIQRAETRLNLILDPAMPPVLFDPSGIKQVLIHLVTNALQAMEDVPPSRRRLLVRTEAPGNGEVYIRVSDSGCGIPEDILPCIFDLFFTTRGVGEGTGIGLSLCRGIIENHGGEITVQSRPGHGTTFCVQLMPDDSET